MTYSLVFTIKILGLFQEQNHATTYVFLNLYGFVFTFDSSNILAPFWVFTLQFIFFPTAFKFIYLLLERGEGEEKERERNIDVQETTAIVFFLYAPSRGTWPQPSHVPWLGIEPVTFQFAGQHSVH